jgi:pimeloyl-ACP methyl ester carboxylesterase
MATISMQPTPAEQDQRVRARDWFASGVRRAYDSERHLQVFEKVVAPRPVSAETRWLTMLPGYPDGSYGYAQVDQHLGSTATPRLYIEYLGQGDSDKPAHYRYATMERADLVQAQWRAHGIGRTMVVTFDYSSLVLLELLRRQQEREDRSETTTIDTVFIVNGGLFADAHSHPWSTTPLLKTALGGLYMRLAQRAPRVFDRTLRNAGLFSRSHQVSDDEIADLQDAMSRRNGAIFLHSGAGFLDEHRRNAARWDLAAVVRDLRATVAFHIAGSEEDPFEPHQIIAARTRLAPFNVDIRMFPGGHLTTAEYPHLLADAIRELADTHGVGEATATISHNQEDQ